MTECRLPTVWRYITLDQLPAYEAEGWEWFADYRHTEEFDSVLVGWFRRGNPPRVKDDNPA